jgi:hypothetical protein
MGVTLNDPIAYIGVSGSLAGVALLAIYVPARHGTQVDPMVALWHEERALGQDARARSGKPLLYKRDWQP